MRVVVFLISHAGADYRLARSTEHQVRVAMAAATAQRACFLRRPRLSACCLAIDGDATDRKIKKGDPNIWIAFQCCVTTCSDLELVAHLRTRTCITVRCHRQRAVDQPSTVA